MKKISIFLSILGFLSCQNEVENFGKLTLLGALPRTLNEVTGNEKIANSKLIWVHNDGGNPSKIFGITKKGVIVKEVNIDAENHDWEDITSDEDGNLYIGDFGNNRNKRKNLRILKVSNKFLIKNAVSAEIIEFEYENQQAFPPEKTQLFFDAEAFFYFKNHFYIFTKSRVKNQYGRTFMYKIPAKPGKHIAKIVGEFYNENSSYSWITAADISDDGTKVVLLSEKNVMIFTDFEGDAFLSGNVKTMLLKHIYQKEGICFKDNNTVFITDEKSGSRGRNLHRFSIK